MVKSRSLAELFQSPAFQLNFPRQAAARIARLQFRSGTLYSTLKPYVPAVAISSAWVIVMRENHAWTSLFRETISVWRLGLWIALVLLWNLVCFSFVRGTRPHRGYLQETLPACIASVACGGALAVVHVVWPMGGSVLSGLKLSAWTLGSYALLLAISWIYSEHLVPLVSVPRTALIIGTGQRGRALLREFSNGKFYDVIGTIDDDYLGIDPQTDRYLGTISELEGILKNKPVEAVLITLPIGSMYNKIQMVIRACETVGVDASYMTDLFETTLAHRQHQRAEHPHLTVLTVHRPDFRRWFKKGFDLVFAMGLLFILSPVLIAIALAVQLTSPGPVFFRQLRYGMHRTRFPMLKFRTMVVDAEARQAELETLNEAEGPVFKIKKDPRVTPIGGFLRKTSLDELPQLFNVLRGEMSVVGPRPLPLRDVERFEESWLLRRFSVKPGITCLWQASGRSNTSFSEWIRLDLQYIDQWSLTLDAKILVMTIPAVLRGRGAS